MSSIKAAKKKKKSKKTSGSKAKKAEMIAPPKEAAKETTLKKNMVTYGPKLLPSILGGGAKVDDEEPLEDDQLILQDERDCLVHLLESRKLLGDLLALREEKLAIELAEKAEYLKKLAKDKGQLNVTEIQGILRKQPDEEDIDWISEIQALKRDLAIEIRRNHVLERDLAKLDKRIALLIKNRGNLAALFNPKKEKKSRRKKKKGAAEEEVPDFTKDDKKIDHYQDLFYLLQTEPRYLARLTFMVKPTEIDDFLDTILITLFGDTFSPREEFLMLKLFALGIEQELKVVKEVSEFIKSTETIVPRMVITYNKRKQGTEYLVNTLKPLIVRVAERSDKGAINLELNPLMIYQFMINQQEAQSGQKSALPRNVPPEEAAKHPQVKKILSERYAQLEEMCELFLDGIISSVDNLPYGFRWICKSLKDLSAARFGDTLDKTKVYNLLGYFVYYRFLNVAIVAPDSFSGLFDGELSNVARKSLVSISQILQKIFYLKTYGKSDKFYLLPMNKFLEENQERVMTFLDNVTKVDNPEDALQVNKYMELTQRTRPLIVISTDEICRMHTMASDYLTKLAPEEEDPLRVILKDLGTVPEPPANRVLQLTLTNRFKVGVEEEDEETRLYTATKALIIPVLKEIPIESSIARLSLMDVLETGIKYATSTENKELASQINKILENIQKLEKMGKVSKADNYESLVHAVALEVANRTEIRNRQRKEIARLTATLAKLRLHQGYIKDQIEDYKRYLKTARDQYYKSDKGKKVRRRKKRTDGKLGPFKFSYKDLVKKRVIIDSEVPAFSQKATTFVLSSEDVGVFEITAKIAGAQVEQIRLELDDLLERHHNGIEKLELDQVTLDVNMTLHLINKLFLHK